MTDHAAPEWGTLSYYVHHLSTPSPPQYIDVRDAALDDDAAIRLADAMQTIGPDRSSGAKIKKLRLRGGRITSAGFLALAESIGGVVGATSALGELDLAHTLEIAVQDVDDFAFGLFLILSVSRLKRLSLEGCLLGPRAGMALAEVVATHGECLETLNLRSNALEDDATICLAKKLGSCKQLRWVDLGMNFIGLPGASALAEALAANPPLQRLDLWGNMLEDAGVVPLARALKTNTKLVELNLGYNRISDVGLDALLHAIFDASSLNGLVDSNHTLRYVFYDHCASDLLRRGCDVRTLFDITNILQLNEVNALMKQSDRNHLPDWAKELPLSRMSIQQTKVAIYLSKCFDMRHFLTMDPSTVAQALELGGKANVGYPILYQILRSMPWLFGTNPAVEGACAGLKRKRAEQCVG